MLSGWAGWHRLHWGRDNPSGASQTSRAFGQEPKRLQTPGQGQHPRQALVLPRAGARSKGQAPQWYPHNKRGICFRSSTGGILESESQSSSETQTLLIKHHGLFRNALKFLLIRTRCVWQEGAVVLLWLHCSPVPRL